MPKVVIGIQARMGSARFPGKMLAELGGRSILAWIFERIKQSAFSQTTILATSTAAENNALAKAANFYKIEVYRGSEDDVLARFLDIISQHQPAHIVRICGDNPLVAPEEVDRIINHHLETGADYSFNHIPGEGNCYPDGLGAEIFRAEVLRQAGEEATLTAEREHINEYVLNHRQQFKIETLPAPAGIAYPEIRLDVDTREDLEYLEQVVTWGKLTPGNSAEEVVSAARTCPATATRKEA